MFKKFKEDLSIVFERDPAARSYLEILTTYPGVHAILIHRLSHKLWSIKLFWLGRFLSHIGRFLTGIEIHPGAKIGSNFFMDHGLGIVIGETTEIGENVTIYQGVTLGGIMPSIESDSQRNQKRHPTIGNNVIIGSGAQILGSITVGDYARIGANSVVSKDVPSNVTVAGVPAREFARSAEKQNFKPYGVSVSDTDPREKTLNLLLKKVENLEKKIKIIEKKNNKTKT